MSISIYVPDSTKILHTAYADFISRQIGRTIHVVQYDDSLPILAVKLFCDGQPYTIPSNADMNIKLGKSDGKFVYNSALGCDESRHIVYFEITYQMVVLAEKVSPVVEVVIGNSVSASSSISIIVDRNPIPSKSMESTSEWKAIQDAVEYTKEAVNSAASASASRLAAKQSETNAKSSEQNASQYANSARGYANSANSASNTASNSASVAKQSETNAKQSEINAKKSETNALQSAEKATTNAKQSETYSDISKSYAIGEGGYRTREETDNAKYYANEAKKSASEIEQRVSSDLTEITNLSNEMKQNLEQVNKSKDSISLSETNAKQSEINAKKSENALNESEVLCKKYSQIAESYAVGDTDFRDNEATDNAKYYYQQAKQITNGLAGALLPMGTVTFSELSAQTKEAGYMYNISDDFTSDSTFKDGGNIKYPAGTNVYYTADGYWDCLAGELENYVLKTEAPKLVKVDDITITKDADGTLHGVSKIDVDSELSETSTNPVENKVIYQEKIKRMAQNWSGSEQYVSLGIGEPDSSTQIGSYLDVESGKVYYGGNSSWSYVHTLSSIYDALNNKVNKSNIVNNLVTTEEGYALDARQGEALDGKITELKKSVSDGKSAIASAITNEGVSTASDASFETMVENIGKIFYKRLGTQLPKYYYANVHATSGSQSHQHIYRNANTTTKDDWLGHEEFFGGSLPALNGCIIITWLRGIGAFTIMRLKSSFLGVDNFETLYSNALHYYHPDGGTINLVSTEIKPGVEICTLCLACHS